MEVIFQAIIAGWLTSLFTLLPTLGIGILYKHGRYLPVWLADHGTFGVYFVHLLAAVGCSLIVGAFLSYVFAALVALLLYQLIFNRFIENNAPLAALLASIGLIQIYQALTSLYGSGKSQHFSISSLSEQFSSIISIPIYTVVLLAFLLFITISVALYFFITKTHLGTQVRLILSDRKLAQHYGLPVRKLDAIALIIASTLVVTGALLKGVKYDLQPQMMFYTGITALVSCVVAGRGKYWAAAPLLAIGIETIVSLVGLYPSISAMQRSIPLLIILIFFIAKSWTNKDNA